MVLRWIRCEGFDWKELQLNLFRFMYRTLPIKFRRIIYIFQLCSNLFNVLFCSWTLLICVILLICTLTKFAKDNRLRDLHFLNRILLTCVWKSSLVCGAPRPRRLAQPGVTRSCQSSERARRGGRFVLSFLASPYDGTSGTRSRYGATRVTASGSRIFCSSWNNSLTEPAASS